LVPGRFVVDLAKTRTQQPDALHWVDGVPDPLEGQVRIELFDHEDGLIADDFAIGGGQAMQTGLLKEFGQSIEAIARS
jgi:hypothetical protein